MIAIQKAVEIVGSSAANLLKVAILGGLSPEGALGGERRELSQHEEDKVVEAAAAIEIRAAIAATRLLTNARFQDALEPHLIRTHARKLSSANRQKRTESIIKSLDHTSLEKSCKEIIRGLEAKKILLDRGEFYEYAIEGHGTGMSIKKSSIPSKLSRLRKRLRIAPE